MESRSAGTVIARVARCISATRGVAQLRWPRNRRRKRAAAANEQRDEDSDASEPHGVPRLAASLAEPNYWRCGSQELAALVEHSYSMIWSARPRSVWGIVRPRALAVLRLITSSNFVGCSIGTSPGLAPLRILST